MPSVEVFTKKPCVQCDATKRMLNKRGVAFVEKSILDDLKLLEELKAAGHMSAPVVLVKDSQGAVVASWSGFNPEKINSIIK